jgi:hypothetical protein
LSSREVKGELSKAGEEPSEVDSKSSEVEGKLSEVEGKSSEVEGKSSNEGERGLGGWIWVDCLACFLEASCSSFEQSS